MRTINILKIIFCSAILQVVSVSSQPASLTAEISPKEKKEVLRMSEGVKKIRYLFWNRSKNEWSFMLYNEPIPEGAWISGGSIKIIVHGYTFKVEETAYEKIDEQGLFDMGMAYVNHNNSINVCIVDWTILSSERLHRYSYAAKSTRYVGKAVAEFLVRLFQENLIKDWANVHIIGFSLGAHTVGVIGYNVQQITGAKVGRITGLDPAGPLFDKKEEMPEDNTGFLEKTDGKFVDIIHCNMKPPKISFVGHLGSFVQAGHADFYPNGGVTQLKCTPKADASGTACSHFKCTEFMRLSLSNELLACPCTEWETYRKGRCNCTLENGGQLMGDQCMASASGKYFISMKNWQ